MIENSNDCAILDNYIGDNDDNNHNTLGIKLDNTDSCTIRDNSTIKNDTNAILLIDSDDTVIHKNEISYTVVDCIILQSSDSSDIMNNDISQCDNYIATCSHGAGIELVSLDGIDVNDTSDHNIITRNYIDKNASNVIAVHGEGNKIRKSSTNGNGSFGIFIGASADIYQCKKKNNGINNSLGLSNEDCD